MFCFHDRLKQFTFKDGTTIKMCPDCTQFDNSRRETLRVGSVEMPKAKEELHWGLVLEKADLPMSAGIDKVDRVELCGDTFGILKAVQNQRLKNSSRINTTLDDSEWIYRQQPFAHSQAMPRRYNSYCAHCVDVVVDGKRNKVRTTKGVYLPIAHDCAAVRVYSLSGVLIEVKVI